MLTRRIVPCLDVRDGRVVKGVRFEGLREMGDPVELAARHVADGADELCFLNVVASVRDEPPGLELVRRVGREVFVPFTVGGGVRGVEDARALLRAGADKVALNTAAIERPALLEELASEFGRQCVVLSVDARRTTDAPHGELGERWVVTSHGGRRALDRECLDWVAEGVERGAGEILLNAIDADGVRGGFALGITGAVASRVGVPVIASGGAGRVEHFLDLFRGTAASAALAASIFHDGSMTPRALKRELAAGGIEVRP